MYLAHYKGIWIPGEYLKALDSSTDPGDPAPLLLSFPFLLLVFFVFLSLSFWFSSSSSFSSSSCFSFSFVFLFLLLLLFLMLLVSFPFLFPGPRGPQKGRRPRAKPLNIRAGARVVPEGLLAKQAKGTGAPEPPTLEKREFWSIFCVAHGSSGNAPFRPSGRARVPVSLARAFGRRAVLHARRCMDHSPKMPSEGLKTARSCPRTTLLTLPKRSPSLLRASNAVRVIMSTRFGTSSGHVENSVQNGPFLHPPGCPGRPAGRWRERF